MAASTACIGRVRNIALRADTLRVVEVPLFLCPILAKTPRQRRQFRSQYPLRNYISHQPARLFDSVSHILPRESLHELVSKPIRLPQQCSGCGAFSQISENGEPGFYSLSRRSVKEFLMPSSSENVKKVLEKEIIEASLRNLGDEASKTLSFDAPATPGSFSAH